MDTDDWGDALRHDTLRRLEQVARMQDELAEVYGEAADGLVRVRVTPGGLPTRLHLAPAAMRLSADELADHLLAAMGAAARQAGDRVRAVVGRVVPPDDLDALVRGAVGEADRAAVREALDGLSPGRGSGAWAAS